MIEISPCAMASADRARPKPLPAPKFSSSPTQPSPELDASTFQHIMQLPSRFPPRSVRAIRDETEQLKSGRGVTEQIRGVAMQPARAVECFSSPQHVVRYAHTNRMINPSPAVPAHGSVRVAQAAAAARERARAMIRAADEIKRLGGDARAAAKVRAGVTSDIRAHELPHLNAISTSLTSVGAHPDEHEDQEVELWLLKREALLMAQENSRLRGAFGFIACESDKRVQIKSSKQRMM